MVSFFRNAVAVNVIIIVSELYIIIFNQNADVLSVFVVFWFLERCHRQPPHQHEQTQMVFFFATPLPLMWPSPFLNYVCICMYSIQPESRRFIRFCCFLIPRTTPSPNVSVLKYDADAIVNRSFSLQCFSHYFICTVKSILCSETQNIKSQGLPEQIQSNHDKDTLPPWPRLRAAVGLPIFSRQPRWIPHRRSRGLRRFATTQTKSNQFGWRVSLNQFGWRVSLARGRSFSRTKLRLFFRGKVDYARSVQKEKSGIWRAEGAEIWEWRYWAA